MMIVLFFLSGKEIDARTEAQPRKRMLQPALKGLSQFFIVFDNENFHIATVASKDDNFMTMIQIRGNSKYLFEMIK
jgi:hypothetical protein